MMAEGVCLVRLCCQIRDIGSAFGDNLVLGAKYDIAGKHEYFLS